MRVGVDVIEKKRWDALRYESRALELVLVPVEWKEWSCRPEYWGYGASRLAAKEAIIKALPVVANYHDFMITANSHGLEFAPLRADLANYRVSVSVAHSTEVVMATAICI